ncbi:MAG: hypothetical protein K0M39_14960 [Rhizobium sp.]|nr:hypothetical protein [Rhizobium sp.]
MKKMLTLLAIFALAGLAYWVSMDDAHKWLFFNENIAEKYASSLLNGRVTAAQPDELIDVQISTYPHWVLFSPHSDDHFLILAYSPNKEPEPITSGGKTLYWRQLKQSWYELEH